MNISHCQQIVCLLLECQDTSEIKDILKMKYYRKEDEFFFNLVAQKAVEYYFKINDIDAWEHSYLLRRFKPYERKAINALNIVKIYLRPADFEEIITSKQLINALKEIKKSLAFIQNVLDSNYTRANEIMQLSTSKLVA
jgi:hypothetical protein